MATNAMVALKHIKNLTKNKINVLKKYHTEDKST